MSSHKESKIVVPHPAAIRICQNGEELLKCPTCGKVDDIDGFDVLGADEDCIFCTQCHQEIQL